MLDNILGLVKNTVSSGILNNSIVPENKKEQTVETTTKAMATGLKQNLSLDNIGNMMSLFGKGNNTATNSNPITYNLQNTVASSLVKEVGLSQTIATAIAATVVPMVMKAISGKIEDPNEKGFNLESLIHSFSGQSTNNQETGSGNNILNTLGKLFGN